MTRCWKFALGVLSGLALLLPHARAAEASFTSRADYCPVSPVLTNLDASYEHYAVFLAGVTSGKASGTMSLYAGASRYDIPFHDFAAEGVSDDESVPTVVVVSFPQATVIDSATVSALDAGDGSIPCGVLFAPWKNTQGGIARTVAELQRERAWFPPTVAAANTLVAPAAVDDPAPCSTPDIPAHFVRRGPPLAPKRPQDAEAIVLVLIDNNNIVIGAGIDAASRTWTNAPSASRPTRGSRRPCSVAGRSWDSIALG
jgi:hypothetical protein